MLGLNYEKLRVAGVVQQGELLRIVEAQPKDFKELLNGLIGIDRLDSTYETMRNVIGRLSAKGYVMKLATLTKKFQRSKN